MSAPGGIPPGASRRDRIPKVSPPHLIDGATIQFSFKHLDLESNDKFNVDRCGRDFLRALLEEIKRMSSWTVAHFCEYDNERHGHYINFGDTTEPEGFRQLEEQLEPELFWQFSVQPNKPWRVHGFLIDATFFIVWLDPEHLLEGSVLSRSEARGGRE